MLSDYPMLPRADSDSVLIRRVLSEGTPLLDQPMRGRSFTEKRRRHGSGRRTVGVQSRLDLGSSTMLDRLVYCYDQTPPKKTGFVLKPSLSCAHLGTPHVEDTGVPLHVSISSPLVGPDAEMRLLPDCYARLAVGDAPRHLEVAAPWLLQKQNVSGLYTLRGDVSRHGWPVWELELEDDESGDEAGEFVSDTSVLLSSSKDGVWVVRTNTDPPRVLAAGAETHGNLYPHEYGGGWKDGATAAPLSTFAVTRPPTEFLLVLGWAALLLGVTAMSSIGPLAAHFQGIQGVLLGCWIAQAMSLVFMATALGSYFIFPRNTFGKPLTWLLRIRDRDNPSAPGGLPVLLLAGVASGVGSGAWTQSFAMTPIPLAYLLASFGPSVIVLFRMISSCAVIPSRLELVGVVVGVLGGVATCVGSMAGGALGTASLATMIFGNILAFTCSVTTAICAMAGKFASCVSTVFYLAGVCVLSGATQAVLSSMLIANFTVTTDPNFGLFGWLHPQWHPVFFYLVLSFVIGQWGLFFFLQVGTALQQAAVMTAQPLIATMLGVLVFGTQAHFPSLVVAGGGLVTIVGSLLVIVAGQHHQIPSEQA
eukprot:TRINITY_DN5842_c2_g1_i1.p1 TRINITY_DN5842_c2_g1~~TRINITY_DN5842_c2_g1_i1.p1  ORF type:complete len:590 (+),score=51.19 TRINITY_DN5842_c2_g1_i1:91-1860(+)